MKDQKGVIMPMFAMTAVVFLMIVFLILDIGQVRITQGDLYKSLDAGALAGAYQSTHHELYDFEQIVERIPIYSEDEFVGYKYIYHDPVPILVDEWVEIDRDRAFQVARDIFWRNANDSQLNENGREVVQVTPNLKEVDVLEMKGEMKVKHQYLPSFLSGLFGKEVSDEVVFKKESDAKAVFVEDYKGVNF